MKKPRKLDKRTVTVGPKYQVVIPKDIRRRCGGFEKGAKVVVFRLDDSTLALRVVHGRDWAKTHRGGLKDLWRGVNPSKQLEKMRDEWDEVD